MRASAQGAFRASLCAALAALLSAPAAVAADPGPGKLDAACRAEGGTPGRLCGHGIWVCVVTFRDGGKRCTDGSQCSYGRCVHPEPDAASAKPAGASGAGVCVRATNQCDCVAEVRHGKLGARWCPQ